MVGYVDPESGSFVALLLLIGLGAAGVFTIATFVKVLRTPEGAAYQSGSKTVWVVVILLTGAIGAALYHLAGKPTEGAGADLPGRHVVHRDPRDSLYWCEQCRFWSRSPYEATGHGRIQSRRMRPTPANTDGQPSAAADVGPATDATLGFGAGARSRNVESAAASLTAAPSSPEPSTPPSQSLPEHKLCPDCAEPVRAAARKCRFCGYMFETSDASV